MIPVCRVREVMLELPHLPLDLENPLERSEHVIEKSRLMGSLQMLPEVADTQSRNADDPPVIRLILTSDQPEKRRLPGTIPPDQSDLLTGIVLPGHLTQDLVRPV